MIHSRATSYLLLVFLLFSLPEATAAKNKRDSDLPLPARMIIAKVSPMIQAEKYDQAIDVLLKFQARGGPEGDKGQPDAKGYYHPEIYFVMGNCYLMQEKYDSAATAYRRAVARDTEHNFAWLNLAKASYEMKQFAEAGHSFGKGYETAAKKNPDHLYYSAASYLMAGDHPRTVQIFERLFARHPEAVKPEWKEHYVHALLASNQPQKALPYIRELARTYTGDKQIQWQEILLYQYLQLKMKKEALTLARTLTRQAPTVNKWWKALTHIQLDAGRQEEALVALTIYSFLTPLSMEEKKLLADLGLQLGIPVKAVPLYENCLQEKPDELVLRRLANAYRQLGQPEKALAAINEFDPKTKDTDLILLQGEMYYALKQFDRAAFSYKKAANNKGRNAGRAWLMAGYAAWQINDLTASKTAFIEAAKHKRQRKNANAALKQLAALSVEEQKR